MTLAHVRIFRASCHLVSRIRVRWPHLAQLRVLPEGCDTVEVVSSHVSPYEAGEAHEVTSSTSYSRLVVRRIGCSHGRAQPAGGFPLQSALAAPSTSIVSRG